MMEKPRVTVAKRHVATETDDRPLFNAACAACGWPENVKRPKKAARNCEKVERHAAVTAVTV